MRIRIVVFLSASALLFASGALGGAESVSEEFNIAKSVSGPKKIALVTGTDYGGNMLVYGNKASTQKLSVRVGLSSKEIIKDFYFEESTLIKAVLTHRQYGWDDKTQTTIPEETSAVYVWQYTYSEGSSGKPSLQASSGAILDLEPLDSRQMSSEAKFFLNIAESNDAEVDIEEKPKTGF